MLFNHKKSEVEGKLTQKAGSNSEQNQIINIGITEERTREIFNELVPKALETYTNEAYQKANERVAKLEVDLNSRLNRVTGLMESYADPAFQVLLRKAQQAAAVTDKQEDYDLLTQLIILHVGQKENRINQTAINKAVQIIADIDNDALCGLTVAHAVDAYSPATGNIKEGIKVLSDLFEKLMYVDLPKGNSWIDHLDSLGTVRINVLGNFKKLIDYYSERLPGYVCCGIKVGSDTYEKELQILASANFSNTMLISNECMDGYARLPILNVGYINSMVVHSQGVDRVITDIEADALKQIYEMYEKDESLNLEAKNNFHELWNSYPTLERLSDWHDNIPTAFYVTQIGKILAQVNAKRCDESLPDLI